MRDEDYGRFEMDFPLNQKSVLVNPKTGDAYIQLANGQKIKMKGYLSKEDSKLIKKEILESVKNVEKEKKRVISKTSKNVALSVGAVTAIGLSINEFRRASTTASSVSEFCSNSSGLLEGVSNFFSNFKFF